MEPEKLCGEKKSWTSIELCCTLPKNNHPADHHYDRFKGCGTRWPTDEWLNKEKAPLTTGPETLTFSNYL